uniref:Photosystem I reaction center subunit VIII n=2 Tax=Chlorellaceae TaxID=35461 RepID=C7BEV2_PARKE|nr:subunit VIII of photosystem I [Parachlorella kessleri]ACQ90934.1 subunit VIII of photosystem I [Parachlorella kessleri]
MHKIKSRNIIQYIFYINGVIKKFMSAQDLPSILVPLVGLVFPAVAMASLFLYVEKEEIN